MVCHAGHELSPPQYARFYCDCGGLPAEKRAPTIAACKCVRTDLARKREQDKSYRNPDEEDDPAPTPLPPKVRKNNVATLFDK
jgi:hypothetical protein